MKLTLLLGSGISIESIPNSGVVAITRAILRGSWNRDATYLVSPGERSALEIQRVQGFLRALFRRLSMLLSEQHRRRIEPTYEDLFYCVDQLNEPTERGILNPLVQPFLKQVQEWAFPFVYPIRPEQRYSLESLFEDATGYIPSVVRTILCRGRPAHNLNFVPALALNESVERLDILTLNHDLLLEQCLTSAGLKIANGFEALNGELRRCSDGTPPSPERSVVRLCKLHGSIDWFGNLHPERRGIYLVPSGDLNHEWRDHEGTPFRFRCPPAMLAGSYSKLSRYNVEPYAFMFRYWKSILNETSNLLVSGYGFGDLAVNLSIIDWMEADPSRQIFVFHNNPEALIANARHWHGIIRDAWKRENRLVFCENWIGSLTADKILDQVAQSST